MPRLPRAALTSLVAFAALVFLLATVEDAFEISTDAREVIGVFIAASSAIAAGALGAWQATTDGYSFDRSALVAAIAPPGVLAVVLALLSGAPTAINVAVAVAGPFGAAFGAFLYRTARA